MSGRAKRMAVPAFDRPVSPPKDGTLRLEVIGGVEGACLAVVKAGETGGFRVAGPKPWGGGRVTHSFTVDDRPGLEAIQEAVMLALAKLDGEGRP